MYNVPPPSVVRTVSVSVTVSEQRSVWSDGSSGVGRSEKSFKARYSSSMDGKKDSRSWRPACVYVCVGGEA